jgi:hypothetical protein
VSAIPTTVRTLADRDAWLAAVLADPGLGAGPKLIAARLALFCNVSDDPGRCDPGYGTLAKGVAYAQRRSAIDAVTALANRGWIELPEQRRGGRRNSFRLVLKEVATVHGDAPPDAEMVHQDTPSMVHPSTPSMVHDDAPSEPNGACQREQMVHAGAPNGASRRTHRTDSRTERRTEESSRDRERGTRLPEHWRPADADLTFAVNQGLDQHQVQREADRFRDYWRARPGAGGLKSDWPATWRNWVRKAVDDQATRRRQPQGRGAPTDEELFAGRPSFD